MNRIAQSSTTSPTPITVLGASNTREQIGPRTPGTEYVTGNGAFRVLAVITDDTEACRVLKRKAARFAVLVRDLHAGTEYYTGAVWTGSDRVLKAVA